MITLTETYVNDAKLPKVWKVDAPDIDLEAACAWLKTKTDAINESIDNDGALLIRGFKCIRTGEDLEEALGAISFSLRDYIVGGTNPRKYVTKKVVTATELPGEYSIPLHQEMSYTANPPNRLIFFCHKPAEEGGFSHIADMRKVTPMIDKNVAARFEEMGVQLRQTLPSEEMKHKKPGVVKTWNESFHTNDPEEVDRLVAEKGWRATWLDNGSVQLWQEVLPAKKEYEKTGEKVWFNQVHMFHPAGTLQWAKRDNRQQQVEIFEKAVAENPEMLDQVFYGDGTPIAEEDVLHIFEIMQQHEVPLAMEASDILFLNNTLVCHGRSKFVGTRKQFAALVA